MSIHEIAVPNWDGSNPLFSEYRTFVKLWEMATPLDASKRAPASILNLTGTPRAAALQLDISKLNAGDGVNREMQILGDTYLDHAVDSRAFAVQAPRPGRS